MELTRRTFLKGAIGTVLAGSLLHPKRVKAASDRVVWVKDANVTTWNGSTGYFGDNAYVNQSRVDNMIAEGVKSLSAKSTELLAWQDIIPTYASGDKIFIKINQNNYSRTPGNTIGALAQVINGVIKGLKVRGVAEPDIYVCDPSYGIEERIITIVRGLYPNVLFWSDSARDNASGKNNAITFNLTDPTATIAHTNTSIANSKLPDQLVTAAYLINIPIMQIHAYPRGVTLAYKNLFGLFQRSTIPKFHSYYNDAANNPMVDFLDNTNIGDKTVLIVGDGIYGNRLDNYSAPTKWSVFGNDWPKSIFLSKDPVAGDCVMYDFLNWENPRISSDENYLIEANAHGQGTRDHWNNPTEKKYSLIDFVKLDVNGARRADIDRKIRDFKKGGASKEEVKETIKRYMEGE